jgi:predicted alpha/beta-hydrolase family hydrolase
MSEKDELINEWIEKADHDLGSAKLIYLHIPQYFDTIASIANRPLKNT